MKEEKIHEALNHLDDDMIQEVETLRNKKNTKRIWIRFISVAACVAVLVSGVFAIAFRNSSDESVGMDRSAETDSVNSQAETSDKADTEQDGEYNEPSYADKGKFVPLHSVDLMENITSNVYGIDSEVTSNPAVTDFAVELFKTSEEKGNNTLISPLSVILALSMTANGAEGWTLSQMESVLGMSVNELNEYLSAYTNSLPQDEKYKLKLANSIWFTDDDTFTVNKDFLQTNANYYAAEIYKSPFDNLTLEDINNWVKHNTDDMIPGILDKIQKDSVMYLINALAFEAEWATPYCKEQVSEDVFTLENGTKQTVEFMYSQEKNYLEDENATGFIKYYKEQKYAFAALLPNEDITVSEYIQTLNGEKLNSLLSQRNSITVNTSIPKFETEYNVEMSDILKSMGMTDAFSSFAADFDSLGESAIGNIYINRVIHKTFISVGEQGTKAGASTAVEMVPEGSAPTEPKTVHLNRPFVYMLIDCETNTPFFIGTMMNVNG